MSAIDELGFTHCTPVQAKSLPHTLAGKDISGLAQTGTGKTAAFLITIIQCILKHSPNNRGPGTPLALVLAPTRELALQIGRDTEELAKHTDIKHLVVYGGMSFDQQARALQQPVDLVIATPGRLIDYIRRRMVKLGQVKIAVIDEADRMLDMGFIPDVRRIMRETPHREQRQTMLFSATLPPDILRLADQWMSDPVRIEIDIENVVAEEIQQKVFAISAKDKLPLLLHLLNSPEAIRVLVFRNRRIHCEQLHRQLTQYGINCALMTGDVPQKKRMSVLEAFRGGQLHVIIATDVAGRGIHVDNITHVVNYDLPYEPEDYVHRIGRTGRAGVQGIAVSFACEESAFVLPEIEACIKQSLKTETPPAEALKLPHPTHPPSSAPVTSVPRSPRSGSRRAGGAGGGGSRRPPRRRQS